MATYDADRYSPPAPIATVELRDLNGTASVADIPMLLDTGADVTMVPRAAVEELGVSLVGASSYELLSFDGKSAEAHAVQLELMLFGRSFRGQFLLLDQEVGILGRNILNLLSVLYDGPRLTWSIGQAG